MSPIQPELSAMVIAVMASAAKNTAPPTANANRILSGLRA